MQAMGATGAETKDVMFSGPFEGSELNASQSPAVDSGTGGRWPQSYYTDQALINSTQSIDQKQQHHSMM